MSRAETSIDSYGFDTIAPAGFYLAVRVGFAFPEFEHNALPRAWVHHYTRSGLMLYDPLMRWIYENSGAIRWRETGIADEKGVLDLAREYGLCYGAAVCISGEHTQGLRTFGTFARSDREFSDDELATLDEKLLLLHHDLSPPEDVTEAELEALRLVRDGLLLKEIAFELGVTESAVKQRLRGAKSKLRARTTAQAVSSASGFGLL